MQTKILLISIAIYFTGLLMSSQAKGQNLEVEGQAKIIVMNADNSADQVVVRQADGTLAVRDASTLSSMSSAGNYGTVVNPVTGKIWLDRNLGASQVAKSSTDEDGYGDLYQWGRAADGHQLRTSSTDSTQATTWIADEGTNPWDGKFIMSHGSWLTSSETDIWSGTASENNPCPSGYRVPTNSEWNQEKLTWTSPDAAGAFASPLKLPRAGYRWQSDGLIKASGTSARYWSSTVEFSSSRALYFNSGTAYMGPGNRASGFSVRCIKD